MTYSSFPEAGKNQPPQTKASLPEKGFLRLSQIIGDPKRGIPAIFPISKSSWWAGVKSGKYPPKFKISERCVAWKMADIMALLDKQAGEGEA